MKLSAAPVPAARSARTTRGTTLPARSLAALQASARPACALLKALAHEDRLVLLCRLALGEFCVSELEIDLGIRQPSLSQHLGVLREQGLVDTRRDGKHVYYRLCSDDAKAVLSALHRRLCSPQRARTARA